MYAKISNGRMSLHQERSIITDVQAEIVIIMKERAIYLVRLNVSPNTSTDKRILFLSALHRTS